MRDMSQIAAQAYSTNSVDNYADEYWIVYLSVWPGMGISKVLETHAFAYISPG
jgi:hypothetical protein